MPIFDTINAKIEFFAMDVQIEAGHTIRLSLASTGEDYLPASTSSIVEVSEGSSSNLLIDIIFLRFVQFYTSLQPFFMNSKIMSSKIVYAT